MEQQIIQPIDKELLKKELTPDKQTSSDEQEQ